MMEEEPLSPGRLSPLSGEDVSCQIPYSRGIIFGDHTTNTQYHAF